MPELAMPEHVLVLMVGLPGSGKTTWLTERGFSQWALSTDTLREWLFGDAGDQRSPTVVFGLLRKILRIRLETGAARTFIDATNLTPADRKLWIQTAEEFGLPVWAVWLDTDAATCIERCAARTRRVEAEVILRMAKKLRPPEEREGFARCLRIQISV